MATSLDSTAGGRGALRRLTDVRLSLSAKIFIGNLVTVGATLGLLFGLGQRGWFAQPENQWVLVIGILVPASAVAWLISRRLTRNLETLMRAARAISTGDLSEAVAVNDDPQWADEIDVLAGTTATMLGNLRDLVAHLQRTAARVKASSSALVEATDAVGQQASGVLEQVASIAQRSEGQAERAEQQGTILDQMATDLRRSADIADEAARSTQATSAAATRGTETSRQALGRMRNVFERVDDAGDAVYRLSERTAEIHAIVQAITQIAEQTHLLSINASIEAARAGDAGRGFAVVAEEIRRLADSSARSAEQINVIVTGIDDHTRSVVNTMRESTRELGEGRKHIDDISRTLDSIVDATHREAEKVSSLSELTRTQLELAVEVVAVADDVRRGAERIAEATRTVEAASSEQRRRSVTLEDSARTLSDLAAELDSVAGGFRL